MKELKTYIQIFRDFVSEYRYENEADQRNIDLKLYHTERVLEIAQYLIEHLKSVIKPELIPLVELSALFHDIGRFEQYRQFKTFADPISVNHALEGVKMLHKHQILSDLADWQRRLVYGAVALHNQKLLPELPADLALLTKITRDADKLDIFEVMLGHLGKGESNDVLTLHLPKHDHQYSTHLVDKIMNQEMIDYKEHKFVNDMFLTAVGWAQQLNYEASLRYFKEKAYHRQIIQYLPQDDKILALQDYMDHYLEKY